MKRLLIALAVMAALSAAHAALDDTQQQIERRFGKPVKELHAVPPATSTALYEQGDVKIHISYMNGRAQYIKYVGKIETSDMDAILKANQVGSQPWVKFANKKGAPKPRIGTAASSYTNSMGAEAHTGSIKKNKFVEFATDAWLKAKAASY